MTEPIATAPDESGCRHDPVAIFGLWSCRRCGSRLEEVRVAPDRVALRIASTPIAR